MAAAFAALLLVTACSSGDDVPDDQVIKPSSAPSGWTRTNLDAVTVATPPEWEKVDTKAASANTHITIWRRPGSTSEAGLEVRVISHPEQPADQAAEALAVSAGAGQQTPEVRPAQITWPDAKDAYLLAYESSDDGKTYASRAFVLDLEDGRQVQVTSIAPKIASASLPEQVLSTVRLKPKPPTSGGGY